MFDGDLGPRCFSVPDRQLQRQIFGRVELIFGGLCNSYQFLIHTGFTFFLLDLNLRLLLGIN